jgi:hypothetical protein
MEGFFFEGRATTREAGAQAGIHDEARWGFIKVCGCYAAHF